MPNAKDPATVLQHALLSRLKLRQLALLQTIDRHRSLGRVAAEMQLSQPAITKALHEVEDIFGSTLFTRSSRGLVPTPAGDAVLHYARRWLAELEATTRVLTSIEAGRSGRLRLGLTQQVPQQLMSAALTHLLDRAPRISVMVREGTTDELVANLLAREIDCAIGRSYDGDASGLVQQAIYEQEPCLIVGARNVKRLSRGPLDWARLARLDWILPPPNTPMRRTYNAVFVGAGVQPPMPILETTSLRGIEMVLRQEPNAITIFARDVMQEMERASGWAALPYRLNWNLPPVSFFTLKELDGHPTVQALREVVVATARRMKHRPA
ncbi:MAG: LysR family transcriptional regulator [Rhodocyclaceae bacterium]|nr:LysR family transcriptional regulator [Pseudomonadota bacterium]MDQ7971602.1 LysR family transcriptional regulator [Rhodocyclaceae bacterium]MDQ8001527.1 LysR family transcriptional regulator [Pseudomonadota bacterium]MDQ8018820.1 LysR family transcriptional regulator [Pseudomonadota bacterium]